MVVGLFVYQQLFSFQIKFSDSPTSCPSRLLFATWPLSVSSCRLNALDAFVRPHRPLSVEGGNQMSCYRATSKCTGKSCSSVRCLTIPVSYHLVYQSSGIPIDKGDGGVVFPPLPANSKFKEQNCQGLISVAFPP